MGTYDYQLLDQLDLKMDTHGYPIFLDKNMSRLMTSRGFGVFKTDAGGPCNVQYLLNAVDFSKAFRSGSHSLKGPHVTPDPGPV